MCIASLVHRPLPVFNIMHVVKNWEWPEDEGKMKISSSITLRLL